MKHEAEEQLIKTLNGQLKDLPGVAKMMVHQYQMASIAECIVSFLMMIVLGYALYRLWKYGTSHADSFNDWPVPAMCGGFCLVVGIIVISITAFVTLMHACAPIYGILSSVMSN